MSWYQKRLIEGNKALPANLKYKLHTDWFWILKKIPRALTAFNWSPPKCLLGYNVRMWDTAEKGDTYRNIYPFGDKLVTWKDRVAVCGAVKYYPNAIQKIYGTWKISFHFTFPVGFHCTIKLWKFKDASNEEYIRGYDGVRLIYFRIGARYDSYDAYYQFPGFFFGFTYN